MHAVVCPESILAPSTDVVAREIEGEIVIVPLTAGVGDMEDELYSLNETGQAIWRKLDGTRPLQQIVAELRRDYAVEEDVAMRDVLALSEELLRRGILVAVVPG
jgi:hypothetical protein